MEAYSTGNVALATGLFSLGVGWLKDDKGKEVPCTVHYDIDTLRAISAAEVPEIKGMHPLDGCKLAHKRLAERNLKRGVVRYMFERSPLFERIIGAWKKHEEWMAKTDQGSDSTTNMEFPQIEPEDSARLYCQFAKNRKIVSTLWKGATPAVVFMGEKQTRAGDEGHTITTGSLKVCSVNATPEQRKKLGV